MTSEDKKLKRCKEKVKRLKKEIIELKDSNEDLLSQLKGNKFSNEEDLVSIDDEHVLQENQLLQKELDLHRCLASMEQNQALKEYISEVIKFLSRTDMPFISSEVADLRAAFLNAKELVPMRGFHEKVGFAVAGGFSSGKSSFINSFIAEDGIKLETGFTPMTSLPTYIDFTENNSVELFDATNKKVSVSLGVYKQLNHDQSPDISALHKNISRVLIKTKAQDKSYPSFYFIDTPGYDPAQSNSTANDERKSRHALSQADALIWLIALDANGTIPKSDLSFLSRNMLSTHKLMIILTKSDLLTSTDIKAILNRVKIDLTDAKIKFEGIQSLSQHNDQNIYQEGCTLNEFFEQASIAIKKPSLIESSAKISRVFQSCISRITESIQSYESMRKAFKNVQIEYFKNDIDNEQVDSGVQEIRKKIKAGKSALNLLKSLVNELEAFFAKHCHYEFDMNIDWPTTFSTTSKALTDVEKARENTNTKPVQSDTQVNNTNNYAFTDEKVSLTKVLQEICSYHPEFSSYIAATVNKILRQQGVLMLNGNQTDLSTHAALHGITAEIRKNAAGEEYKALLYNRDAKLYVLGLLKDSL